MNIIQRTVMSYADGFRDILKKQQYEKLVLAVLNRSHIIPNIPLEYNEEQAHGECDFIDSIGTKYEVKLLLDSKQGGLIGERKNDIIEWIDNMIEECSEFANCIIQRDLSIITDTKLYKIMRERLQSIEKDEVAILFIPFPIVQDFSESVFMQFTTDYLQAIYEKLKTENAFSCGNVFFLYPCSEKEKIVLRNANTREREYITAPEIVEYISFDSTLEKD